MLLYGTVPVTHSPAAAEGYTAPSQLSDASRVTPLPGTRALASSGKKEASEGAAVSLHLERVAPETSRFFSSPFRCPPSKCSTVFFLFLLTALFLSFLSATLTRGARAACQPRRAARPHDTSAQKSPDPAATSLLFPLDARAPTGLLVSPDVSRPHPRRDTASSAPRRESRTSALTIRRRDHAFALSPAPSFENFLSPLTYPSRRMHATYPQKQRPQAISIAPSRREP